MFSNINAADYMVLLSVAVPLLTSLMVLKTNIVSSAYKAPKIFFGVFVFSILFALNFSLIAKVQIAPFSLMGSLFSVTVLTASLSTAVLSFVGGIFLVKLKAFDKNKYSDLFFLLGLATALCFSNSLILIFVFSEIIFFKTLLEPTQMVKLSDFQGAKVRLLGLVLLLGSVAMNLGSGKIMTLDFLSKNADALYSSDHLFVLAAVFILAGLFELVWRLFRLRLGSFGLETVIGGFGILVLCLKLSSAHIFSTLQGSHTIIQWFAIVSLLFLGLELSQKKTLKSILKGLFVFNTLLSLIFLLPLIFDGVGVALFSVAYFVATSFGLIVGLCLEEKLSDAKGSETLILELKGLKLKNLKLAVTLVVIISTIVAFPIGFGFLILLPNIKMILSSGFYWVGAWVLFSLLLIWPLVKKVTDLILSTDVSEPIDSLWRSKEIKALPLWGAVFLTLLTLGFPIASARFFGLM